MLRFAALLLCCGTASAAPPDPKVLKAHDGWVSAVAFNPDGSRLAVASADKTVSVWDTATWKETLRLKGHTDYVSAVAWSPDGKQLLTGSFDKTAKLWDAATGAEKLTLKGHKGVVMAVAFDPSGGALTSGIDGRVRGWNVTTGKELAWPERNLSWVNALVQSPNVSGGAIASSDNTIRMSGIWGNPTLEPKAAEVRSLSFTPNGRYLAAGTRYGVTKVWAATAVDVKEVASLKGKHTGDVWGVAFGAGGMLLAAADGDWNKPSDVVLWDTTTWKEKARLKHTNEVLCVAFHPTKPLVAAGAWDKTVRVWDVSEFVPAK
jgi:WD40 repeat protein